MDYLILSDSHGRAENVRRVIHTLQFIPAGILFLGDGLRDLAVFGEFTRYADIPIWSVAGNCDSFFDRDTDNVPLERSVWLENKKILLLHSHTGSIYPGSARMLQAAKENTDIVFYGHTHTACEETVPAGTALGGQVLPKAMLLANPGSIGKPRDGGNPSFGVLTIRKNTALFSVGRLD